MRNYVDRGDVLNGINTAVKDHRIPYNMPRAIKNLVLPDGRAVRRRGSELFGAADHKAQMLVRQTSTEIINGSNDPDDVRNAVIKTPLSYALLPWSSDFQFDSEQSKTLEFLAYAGDLEPIVETGYLRVSTSTYGAGRIPLSIGRGAVLYDQTVLANYFDLRKEGATYNVRPEDGVATHVDTFPLSSIKVSYTASSVYLTCYLVDTANNWYEEFGLVNNFNVRDGIFRVSVVYDADTRELSLLVNGTQSNSVITLSVDQEFAGVADRINGRTEAIRRDIVLLNEHIARASYASTAKIGFLASSGLDTHGFQTYAQTKQDVRDIPDPWALCPSAGAGMGDLRLWLKARAADEIIYDQYSKLAGTEDDLAAYYPLDDGGSICRDIVSPTKYITIHHGLPGYVSDVGFLSSKGLALADGQHIKLEFGAEDYKGIQPAHARLQSLFGWEDSGVQGKHDFTVQMRIRTPVRFPQELNRKVSSSTITNTNGDTRDSMSIKAYGLSTGEPTAGGYWAADQIRDESGTAITVGGTQQRWHRAYDSTLFSIEGQQIFSAADVDNGADNYRVPLVRGLLTPEGKIAFEFFNDVRHSSDPHAREQRIVTDTVLSTNTPYTITFVKESLYFYDSGIARSRAYGYVMRIYLNTQTTPILEHTVGEGGSAPSTDISITNGMSSSVCSHGGVRDILIGASYVNNYFDRSIAKPSADSSTLERRAVSQHFMSPYQDQPGFFTFGFFRLWSTALQDSEIAGYADLDKLPERSSLIFNLTIRREGSDQIPDEGPHRLFWKLAYKGWGIPEYSDTISTDLLTIGRIGWQNQDRLGYGILSGNGLLDGDTFVVEDARLKCRLLSTYSATLGQEFGLLTMFGSSPEYSPSADGQFSAVRSRVFGLTSEFGTTSRWYASTYADKTVITSYDGRPLVFDGKALSLLGFGEWSGGKPVIAGTTGGSLTSSMWYGVRIVYYSESTGTYDFSPQTAVKLGASDTAISVTHISPHADTRATALLVAITLPQSSLSLALGANVSMSSNGFLPNVYTRQVLVTNSDYNTLIPTDVTAAPVGAYSAAYGGRLYIAGDKNIPDIIYYSDVGNIERWDTLTNRLVLEDGTGDRIVGIVAMFGALYAFKPNSIWRIVEVGIGEHNVAKIANIGASSTDAIVKVVIPDTGRAGIVFWSHHGPYLFDEVNLKYLGYPIEQGRSTFSAFDPSSVLLFHDVSQRLLFFQLKLDGGTEYTETFVYNYRFNSWTTATGIPGDATLSVDITKRILTTSGLREESLVLLGGNNGALYKVTDNVYDGVPASESYSGQLVIDSLVGNNVSLSVQLPLDELPGLWATVVSKDFNTWSEPLKITANTTTELTLSGLSDYSFEADDYIYLGFVPAHVEFPWDQLNMPYYEKLPHALVLWAIGTWYMQLYYDWQTTPDERIRVLETMDGRLEEEQGFGKSIESLKMQLTSFDTVSELHAYGFIVEQLQDSRHSK